jgi:hypothetical protein
MTWTIDTQTGELRGPKGAVRATLDGPPYRIPDDAQQWAEDNFRNLSMNELTVDILADYAQLWVGDVETVKGQT